MKLLQTLSNWQEAIDVPVCGEALEFLKWLPDECADMCMTSPPYYGLRNYGVDGQIGLEKTFNEYLKKILEITAEIKRVLKPTGQFWLNLGDAFANKNPQTSSGLDFKQPIIAESRRGIGKRMYAPDFTEKCLMMMPERIAMKMIDDGGWILRNRICWTKQIYDKKENRTRGSVMPSSVRDRLNESWEYLYFFSKSSEPQFWTNEKTDEIVEQQPKGTQGIEGKDWRWIEHSICEGQGCDNKRCIQGQIKRSYWEGHDYWCDLDAVRLPSQTFENRPGGFIRSRELEYDSKYLNDYSPKAKQSGQRFNYRVRDAERKKGQPQFKASEEEIKRYNEIPEDYGKKKLQNLPDKGKGLNRWMSGTPNFVKQRDWKQEEAEGYKMGSVDPHRAALKGGLKNLEQRNKRKKPNELKAMGVPATYIGATGEDHNLLNNLAGKNLPSVWLIQSEPHNFGKEYGVETDHFATFPQALCEIPIKFGCPEKGIVLDPFGGSFTTALVAKKLGRRFLSCDLNEKYCHIANKRLAQGIMEF